MRVAKIDMNNIINLTTQCIHVHTYANLHRHRHTDTDRYTEIPTEIQT